MEILMFSVMKMLNNMKKYLLIFLGILFIPIANVFAMPKFPMAFYGNVTINNSPAPAGTVVTAYYGNEKAGEVTINQSGIYGVIDAVGQKLLVSEGVGVITFKVNGIMGNTVQSHSGFIEGESINKDLRFVTTSSLSGSSSGGGSSSSSGGGGSRTRTETLQKIETPVPVQVIETNMVTDNALCPAHLLLTQNLRTGARNGRYHSYTKAVVTQANILQSHLNRLGFNSGKVDGILGPITDGAIKRMQIYLGTKADGYVGPITRDLINKSCASLVLQKS